ncbi:MAG: hypothetical protein PHV37_02965 [Candidatus Gastranaerophilales bacterium]|nr:hypothetical protein [Candidatus Gastranaerophilales bacterium]
MTVNFNTQIDNKPSVLLENMTPRPQQQIAALKTSTPVDKIDLQTTPKKKGFVQKIKDFIGSCKKIGVNINEYTKSTFKGIGQGFFVGSGAFTIATIARLAKKKEIGNMPKVVGVMAGVTTLAANLWTASLNANERKAGVDHRWTQTPTITK